MRALLAVETLRRALTNRRGYHARIVHGLTRAQLIHERFELLTADKLGEHTQKVGRRRPQNPATSSWGKTRI